MTADQVLANLPIREADRQQGFYAEEEAAIREAFALLRIVTAASKRKPHRGHVLCDTAQAEKAAAQAFLTRARAKTEEAEADES